MNDKSDKGNINYWLSICPFELSDNDRRSLLTKTDAEWVPHTWEDLKHAIACKDLGNIARYPTSIRKYIYWRLQMRDLYPDISMYIMTHRLNWPHHPASPSFQPADPKPLADSTDYTLRRNDWPYAIPETVSHVIVWLKHRLPVNDVEVGKPTPEATQAIEDFVQRVFRDRLDGSNSSADAEVIWFKNPVKWQSVQSLEHFHVLMRGVDDRVVEDLTGQRREDIIERIWDSEVSYGGEGVR